MNILQEIILPIAPFIGVLLFLSLILFLLKSGNTEAAFFLLVTSFVVVICISILWKSSEIDTKFGNLSQYAFQI